MGEVGLDPGAISKGNRSTHLWEWSRQPVVATATAAWIPLQTGQKYLEQLWYGNWVFGLWGSSMTKKGGDPAYVGFTWRRWTGFGSVQMNQNTEHLALDQSLILSFPCIYVRTFPSANKECLNNVWTRQGNSGATLERGSQMKRLTSLRPLLLEIQVMGHWAFTYPSFDKHMTVNQPHSRF